MPTESGEKKLFGSFSKLNKSSRPLPTTTRHVRRLRVSALSAPKRPRQWARSKTLAREASTCNLKGENPWH